MGVGEDEDLLIYCLLVTECLFEGRGGKKF